MMKGYEEAAIADRLTNKLLVLNPVTKDNVLEWMKYSRTIKTTMEIIMDECQHILFEERNKSGGVIIKEFRK